MKKKWADKNYRDNHYFLNISKEKRIERLQKANIQRKLNKCNKEKKTYNYKDLIIIKNNITKIIKENQFSAYKKFGWLKYTI